jgi:hypothetical protein
VAWLRASKNSQLLAHIHGLRQLTSQAFVSFVLVRAVVVQAMDRLAVAVLYLIKTTLQ